MGPRVVVEFRPEDIKHEQKIRILETESNEQHRAAGKNAREVPNICTIVVDEFPVVFVSQNHGFHVVHRAVELGNIKVAVAQRSGQLGRLGACHNAWGKTTPHVRGLDELVVVGRQDRLELGDLGGVQVIKGWVDDKGDTHERIYDVAVSDGREIGRNGRCRQPVGNTVDVEKATFTNSIGDVQLMARWTDPDFDPGQPAFYYVRVLEIPTPRWTTYDAAFFGIKRPDTVPGTIQDRAYTSPIWYTP